ncbi:RrF2 family transcriptional regulator [Tritonibacter horizontis]|uniref:HTH-type transcriptional repressor NsrR n=1 Tax=Tritonibacter horizontis TaxID=1768241 RepID=A0A132BQE8_9RHOB|nr:Rrf2 family transcriptional regulator [Tritonibacter horizontis]KUP90633.1 HTH-type transcriptional repressor NsrR [Tritonibacter horizontis]
MRITKRTNIAVRLLMYCAVHEGRLVTRSEVAARCNISENHLAQVVNQLGQVGVLATRRGRNGGLQLARPAAEICIGEIFRAFEGKLPLVECFADLDNTCPLVSACRLRNALMRAGEAFYVALDHVTLDSLTCDNFDLYQLLAPAPCRQAQAMPRG